MPPARRHCRATIGRPPPRSRGGFTLVELVLALAVGAIVLGIAVPSYRSYVDRAKTAAAIADLVKLEARIEKYRLTNNDTLPPDLAAIGMGALLDPWGHPYAYLSFAGVNGRGALRKDKSLNPLNSDYDLYSMGADGLSAAPLTAKASQDDVIRASDGAFVGLAADF